MKQLDIYLASSSPRRQELLKQVGLRYEVIVTVTPETQLANESPTTFVRRIAIEKAKQALRSSIRKLLLPVLAADTMIICDDIAFGKPKTEADAKRMLSMLSGRQHSVITAIALIDETREEVDTSVTKVYFKVLSEQEISNYCKTKEPYDKAGAYAIQGLGALFISHIEGSYSGVMGLPLFETGQLLKRFGITIL